LSSREKGLQVGEDLLVRVHSGTSCIFFPRAEDGSCCERRPFDLFWRRFGVVFEAWSMSLLCGVLRCKSDTSVFVQHGRFHIRIFLYDKFALRRRNYLKKHKVRLSDGPS
jgi:hypothetical protein